MNGEHAKFPAGGSVAKEYGLAFMQCEPGMRSYRYELTPWEARSRHQ